MSEEEISNELENDLEEKIDKEFRNFEELNKEKQINKALPDENEVNIIIDSDNIDLKFYFFVDCVHNLPNLIHLFNLDNEKKIRTAARRQKSR